MKNILVPVGSSKNAVSNLQYAIDFAEKVGEVNIYVIAVFKEFSKVGGGSKLNTVLREDTENRLNEVLNSVDFKGVTVVAHPLKGGIVEGVERFNKHISVDLMIIGPRSNSIKEEVYLGNTSGKLVKQTTIPILVVPEGYGFKPVKSILMAFKNGTISSKDVLTPLEELLDLFNPKLNLLRVTTPDSSVNDKDVDKKLNRLKDTLIDTENATTFQGVIEHFKSNNPDMLCVIRRKRGFFQKLWEKNVILKKEFHCNIPLLILNGE